MGKTFVYADPHFAHASILTYAQRPWVNVDKMESDLIKLYNTVVSKEDTVYWLGDVTLRTAEKWQWLAKILSRMNGTKILVFGNHDDWHWSVYLKAGFQSVHSFLALPWVTTLQMRPADGAGYDHQKVDYIHLCHDPAWAQDKSKLWICGHLHNCAFTAPSHIAIVSVELTEYKPVLVHDIVGGLRPGEGVLRTPPRLNREPEEWRK